jgi:periplasmic divalent cation tolerance protein
MMPGSGRARCAASMIEHDLVEIRTTFAAREAALACADQLVRSRLAACVQVDGPITSIYAWQGAVETASEWRCSCKTTRGMQDACLEAISRMHGYETPELIVSEHAASASYAAWVHASVGPAPEESPEGMT